MEKLNKIRDFVIDLIIGGAIVIASILLINLVSIQNEKGRLEIKRLQYEIKLMEEQGIPVDVE